MAEPAPDFATVILVEDNEFLQKPLVRVLATAGYQTQVFPDAETALGAIEELDAIHAIVSDFRLAGPMSGLEFLTAAEEKTGVRVLISGFAKDVSPELLEANGIHFLQKPFHMKELVALIDCLDT